MWHDKKNRWLHYVKNIMATDMSTALYLAAFLKKCPYSHHFYSSVEVIDLQRYKVIKDRVKVKRAIVNERNTPFVFVVGKN